MIEYYDYIIVQGHKDSLVKDVNEKLKAGYVPIGGVAVLAPEADLAIREDFCYQAMARRSASSRRET